MYSETVFVHPRLILHGWSYEIITSITRVIETILTMFWPGYWFSFRKFVLLIRNNNNNKSSR